MHFDNQLKGHSISETQSNGNIIHETPIVPLIVNTHKWKRIPDFIMLKILLIKKFWILVLKELCPDFLLSTRIPLTDWQGLSVRNFELNITVYYQIFLQNGIKLVFVPSKLFSHCKNLVISLFFFNKEYGKYDYLLFISLPTEVNNWIQPQFYEKKWPKV